MATIRPAKYANMVVLSLFDGMSCGQIALNRLGIVPAAYYAAEIKPHAIKVTTTNFPATVEIGDVRKVHYNDGQLKTENGTFEAGKIDLLIGGSPCQDLSNLMSERKGLEGDKSSLFWEYVRLVRETKPRFFLLENVGSMSAADRATITKAMGVDGVRINSALVSAQFRDRIYWTNIPGTGCDLFSNGMIVQPADKRIMLADVLESGHTDRKKALCLAARGGGVDGRTFLKAINLKRLISKGNYYTDTKSRLIISFLRMVLYGCYPGAKWSVCRQCRRVTPIALITLRLQTFWGMAGRLTL